MLTHTQATMDMLSGRCSHCGSRREDTRISASGALGIGYHEIAVSAERAFAVCRAALETGKQCPPLDSSVEPVWADWCERITGRPCCGCYPVISAEWMVHNPVLMAQGALPANAFVPHTDCTLILFVSHRWETPFDPDANGRQSLFLRMFLASRLTEEHLAKTGVWYDYCVLPQAPRTHDAQIAFEALVLRIPEIQAACQTLVCGTLDDVRTYSTRGWCLLEYLCRSTVDPDFADESISHRAAFSHAVAKDEASAMLQALAYLMARYVSSDEQPWICPSCGFKELSNSRLQATHKCIPTRAVDPEIERIWARLDRLRAIASEAGVASVIPEFLRQLTLRRSRSWLEMTVDFNWALHCGYCWDVLDGPSLRRTSQDETEVLRTQLSLCQRKSRQVLLAVDSASIAAESVPERWAQEFKFECTYPADISVVVGLMRRRASDVLNVLANAALLDDNGATTAHRAAERQDLPMLKQLLQRNPTIVDCRDKAGWTLLHSAAFGFAGGDPALIERLIEVRPELLRATSRIGEAPIAVAVRYGDVALVTLLFGNRPEMAKTMTAAGESLLHLAAWNSGDIAISEFLIVHVPELLDGVNNQKETVLHSAAKGANVALVRLLLQARPSMVTSRDIFGDTPLHAAVTPAIGAADVQSRALEIVRLLLDANPEIRDVTNWEGLTASELALEEGEVEGPILDLLSGQV